MHPASVPRDIEMEANRDVSKNELQKSVNCELCSSWSNDSKGLECKAEFMWCLLPDKAKRLGENVNTFKGLLYWRKLKGNFLPTQKFVKTCGILTFVWLLLTILRCCFYWLAKKRATLPIEVAGNKSGNSLKMKISEARRNFLLLNWDYASGMGC